MKLQEIKENLYLSETPLPGSPLKIVNSYIIVGEGSNLLVDVGYDNDESEQAISESFEKLGLDFAQTDVFLTHLHGDHTGQIERLKHKCRDIYISEFDGVATNRCFELDYWAEIMAPQKHMGLPEGEQLPFDMHPGYKGGVKTATDFKFVHDGDILKVGEYTFEVTDLKGHTPGMKGLHEREKKFLLCGDHILKKITPNINSWDFEHDYLGFFLDSLNKVKEMDLELLLPAHRAPITDYKERIDELIAHHDRRLGKILTLLAGGEKTVYEVALGVPWDFSTSYYGDFPTEQKWFAGNEIFAHLEHLRRREIIGRREAEDGTYFYYLP